MAAFDAFESFLSTLGETERLASEELRKVAWADLVAARSEEARLRIVATFVAEVRERLAREKE